MDKRSLDILEKAFMAQVNAAIGNDLGIIQTKSKLAEKLAADGYLEKETVKIGGRFPVTVEGYSLTMVGHLAYCISDRCNVEE